MTTDRIEVYTEKAAAIVDVRMRQPVHTVPTGLPDIDKAFRLWGDRKGIPRGSYVIIGGASSAGKTRFGLWLMKNAVAAGESAELISMEMPQDELLIAQMQGIGGLEYNDWLPSQWTEGHGDRLMTAVGQRRASSGATLNLCSLVGRSQLGNVMDALEEGRANGCTFFVVDHLQLVKMDRVRDMLDRVEIVSETLREWAFSNRVTVVGLSQLKRSASENYFQTPSIHDLWGGTSMESNASIILMLDHTRLEWDEQRNHILRYWLMLGKSRIGPDKFGVPVEVDFAKNTYRQMMQDEEYNFPRRRDSK
jgi:replicative DNA helicase